MEQKMFAGDSPEKRRQMLYDNCEKIEELEYRREFDSEELAELKDHLSRFLIQLNTLEEELEEIKNEYKEKTKPLKQTIKETMNKVRDGSELVKQQCYKFMDWDEKQVGFYNDDGELVMERPMMKSERQSTIFTLKNKAE
jgi:chromosome segregation ATPase